MQGSGLKDLVIVATGSEVSLAIDAAKLLAGQGINARVVSMPCVERFMGQDKAFRDEVIPPSARKVSIEAGTTIGWERVVGSDALLIGINHFGASAPCEILAKEYGFTPSAVAERVVSWIK